MDSSDYEMVSRKKVEGELQVTGISRSGRVRKKSSKLTDFESPDEIDRVRRKPDKLDVIPGSSMFNRQSTMMASSVKKDVFLKPDLPFDSDDVLLDDLMSSGISLKDDQFSESDNELGLFPTPNLEEPSSLDDSLGSGLEEDDDDLELNLSSTNALISSIDDSDFTNEGFQRIIPESPENDSSLSGSSHSLYMLEKSAKKKLIIRDGKIIGRMKAQRKDKGKTRFTAYMLWSKEIRQELLKSNPELDFSQTSKKLGELWATVPFSEKYIWKRRAKRMAAKGSEIATANIISTANSPNFTSIGANKKLKPLAARKFINKPGGGGNLMIGGANIIPQQILLTTQPSSNLISAVPQVEFHPPPARSNKSTAAVAALVSEPIVGVGLYKVIGTEPIDVAAHLRLLGESLSIIGERLKEHEGQIAVSGSLSVLLDSLLCALTPLLCLTQKVPEMNVVSQQKLTKSLDNIAYIMPGL